MTASPAPPGPLLPLPAPLRGSDPGSFAERTLTQRLPGIARRVLGSSDWHPQAQARLAALAESMPHAPLRLLDDPLAPDADAWERDLAPYVGQTWLQAPWFVAETYFFRRILEATGYYQPGAGHGVDPYLPQKNQEIAAVYSSLPALCADLDAIRSDPPPAALRLPELAARMLQANIWGNQADRSMWPAGSEKGPVRQPPDRLSDNLLIDDSSRVGASLSHGGEMLHRVDIILDNGGIELAYDLGLVDFLLAGNLAQKVVLHAKAHPTYVSDVTLPDIHAMIDYLEAAPDACLPDLAQRLAGYLASGELSLTTDFYWTSPLSGWQMPGTLRTELESSNLIVSKGDANYRRWLGDRHWPHTTPVEAILAYFPFPLIMLRVLKANIVAGLPAGLPEAMDRKDPEWLVDGNWGLIQASGLPW
jgi:hypothetical protein